MLRWVNLGLAAALAALLVMEFVRSRTPGPPATTTIGQAAPVVAQERPGRRARRTEARLAIEEARRRQRERVHEPAGPPLVDSTGLPVMD
jgi:hypothetical protein